MGNFKRMNDTELRKEEILRKTVPLATKLGYDKIKRESIAEAAGCSSGLITHRFGTMVQFRRAMIRYAVTHQILAIIAQGLAAGDAHAKKAPEKTKREALASLA